MLKDFSYDSYKQLLKLLLKNRSNLCFKDFIDDTQQNDFLILRHDVDFSPESALRMAEIESSMGIKATYFVLLTCQYYNLLNEKNILFPRRLVEMGHEVGLHYDSKVFELIDNDPMNLLLLQSSVLSQIADYEIKSISMHNPSLSGTDPFRGVNQFINAYDERFTKSISYFSDSCGAWRDEFVACLREDNIPSRMQLLIHPIFWREEPESRWIRLDHCIHGKINSLLERAMSTKKKWGQHPGVIQHDRRI
jgi:hypothetical protein